MKKRDPLDEKLNTRDVTWIPSEEKNKFT